MDFSKIIDDPQVKFRINGLLYRKSEKEIEVGDMIIDRKDGCYGVVEEIMPNGKCNVRDRIVVEIGCPVERLQRLEIDIATNQEN